MAGTGRTYIDTHRQTVRTCALKTRNLRRWVHDACIPAQIHPRVLNVPATGRKRSIGFSPPRVTAGPLVFSTHVVVSIVYAIGVAASHRHAVAWHDAGARYRARYCAGVGGAGVDSSGVGRLWGHHGGSLRQHQLRLICGQRSIWSHDMLNQFHIDTVVSHWHNCHFLFSLVNCKSGFNSRRMISDEICHCQLQTQHVNWQSV